MTMKNLAHHLSLLSRGGETEVQRAPWDTETDLESRLLTSRSCSFLYPTLLQFHHGENCLGSGLLSGLYWGPHNALILQPIKVWVSPLPDTNLSHRVFLCGRNIKGPTSGVQSCTNSNSLWSPLLNHKPKKIRNCALQPQAIINIQGSVNQLEKN